jgi:hypothetical protein
VSILYAEAARRNGSRGRRFVGWRHTALPVIVTALAALAFSGAPASATTAVTLYTVASSGANSGSCTSSTACTLSHALTLANGGTLSGDNVVIELAAGTYPVSGSAYSVTGGSLASLTINGVTAKTSVINGGYVTADGTSCPSAYQVLTITSVTFPVNVDDLTLENGCSAGSMGNPGADLWADASNTVTLDDDAVDSGYDQSAGLADSTSGTLDINQSSIVSGTNSTYGATARGGALNVANSFVGFNSGEGVFAESGPATVTGSTITSNGGAEVAGSAHAVTLAGDILFGPGANCSAAATDDGYNIADDTSCDLTASTSHQGTQSVVDGQLGTLGLDSTGPTETVSIASASDAYDIVPANATGLLAGFCAGSDQEGVSRLQPGQESCDAGAYQVSGQNFAPTITGVSQSTAAAGASVTLSGTNLGYATTVAFGAANTPGTITAQSATSITVTVPALASGSQAITATNPDGHATVAFSVPAPPVAALAPAVTIESWNVNVHKSSASAVLSCANQGCAGQFSFTSSITKTIKEGHHKTRKATTTTTIASGSFTIAEGASDDITVKLTRSEKAAYAKLKKKHHLHLLLSVDVNGGTYVSSKTES